MIGKRAKLGVEPPARRLEAVALLAHTAEADHDDARAGEAWRRYRLIRDASRDPDELLATGIAFSERILELAASLGDDR